jgi:hypothetical protein
MYQDQGHFEDVYVEGNQFKRSRARGFFKLPQSINIE